MSVKLLSESMDATITDDDQIRIEAILAFWFKEQALSAPQIDRRMDIWFGEDEVFDLEGPYIVNIPPMVPHSFQNLDDQVAELVVIFPTNVWEYDVLDYFPFESGFRLTGGIRYNAETPDLIEGPSSAITLGGLPFTPSGGRSPGAGQDFIGYAPYGGLGLQSRFWEGRLELIFDLGVYYQAPDDETDATDGAAALDSNNGSERTEEELRFLDLHPIIGLSATYRF